MRFCKTLVLIALFSISSLAQAPPGWKSFDDQGSGVRLYRPKEFLVTPVAPTEKLILAKFSRKTPYRAKRNERRAPESFQVFVLYPEAAKPKKAAKPSGLSISTKKKTPEEIAAAKKAKEEREAAKKAAAGTKDKKKKKGDADYDAMYARMNKIHDWETYMKKRHSRLSYTATKGRKKPGEFEFALRRKSAGGQQLSGDIVGYLNVRIVEGQTWGVIGFCDKKVSKAFKSKFQRVAKSMHIPEGFKTVKRVTAEFYEGKDYRGIAHRVKTRNEMVKGWKAKDTKNFLVLYHTKNMKLVNKISGGLAATLLRSSSPSWPVYLANVIAALAGHA